MILNSLILICFILAVVVDVNAKRRCTKFLTVYRDTSTAGTNTTTGVQVFANYNFYSDAKRTRKIGTIQQMLTYVGGGDCLGHRMFSFYKGSTQAGQIASPFTCAGLNNPVTGAWGPYAGVDGYMVGVSTQNNGYRDQIMFYDCA